jgi:glycosyltransferase involved in cell wall biosynthesis
MECHAPFWELKEEKLDFFSLSAMIRNIFRLFLIYIRLTVRYFQLEDHDAVIVGYNGYLDMPVAKLLTRIRGKPLIFTPVFPLYETAVEDRQYVNKNSLPSKAIHLLDRISCRLADLIIIETQTYLDYYSREFKIRKEKYFKIPLGADERNYFPRPQEKHSNTDRRLRVLFYGKFIPLQGIPYIIEAAKLLEKHGEIEFEIIGRGQLSEDIQNLAQRLNIKNTTFIDWIVYERLPLHIQKADICLGIFGTTHKAQRGIPIKVYESLAMKKPVITGDSPAAREVFTHKVNAVLCEMGNPQALAESILLLKENQKLREAIAGAGFKLYQDLFSSNQIARKFEMALNECLH